MDDNIYPFDIRQGATVKITAYNQQIPEEPEEIEEPEEPDLPETPEEPASENPEPVDEEGVTKANAPQTGDREDFRVFALLLIALGGLSLAAARRKREEN